MTRFTNRYWLFGLLLALLLLPLTVNANGNGNGNAPEQARVYVEYAPGQRNAVQGLLHRENAQFHYEFAQLNSFVVTLPVTALNGIRRNPRVVDVEDDPVRELAAAPDKASLAQLTTAVFPQVVPYGVTAVQAPEVWADGYLGAGRKVCIIDTGYLAAHEDLPDDVDGVSQIPGELYTEDGYGHGTHVAGTIAGIDNEVGVIGVAPGVDLFIVKIFDNDGLWVSRSSDVVAAIYRCEEAGSHVISMSFSGTQPSKKEQRAFDAIYSRGILSVAAASNDALTEYHYPASYDSVISVAAVDSDNNHAAFSQMNDAVELAAPGVAVLSTVSYLATAEVQAGDATYPAIHVYNSAHGTVTAPLADGGLCLTAGQWSGQVVLCARGDITFYDKVMSVQAGGGVATIIYNNEPGSFGATLGDGNSSVIPAVSVSQEDGLFLLANNLGQETTVVDLFEYPGSGYEAWSGTSMSTPHVSAVAALIWSANPTWSNEQVRVALQQTALDLGDPGRDVLYGFGLVQAKAALDWLAAGPVSMHVADMGMAYTNNGRNYNLYTTVAVVDETGAAVANATVYLDMETPDGLVLTNAALTGADGVATFHLRTRVTGHYVASVTDITHDRLTYLPGSNLVTSAAITIPQR
jgi:serine protease